MPKSRKPLPKRQKRTFPWKAPFLGKALLIPAVLLVLLGIGSFGVAANMEEKDAFCASCHTQPESTFYNQFQAGQSVDLATYHHTKAVKCIDCHSGVGVVGRAGAIMMGSHNAIAYFTKTATQPAPLTVPIGDSNCVKCHVDTLKKAGFDNHFHTFLARWQAKDPSAAGCVDCHAGHARDGNSQIAFLNEIKTEAVCERCHNALGE